MMQFALVSFGAGAAAALLFATAMSGSWLSIILVNLAPLPLLIAALGWTHWAALIGGVGAALVLFVLFGGIFLLAFITGVGLPAWWLGYLAMLARPGADGGTVEWYPPGRLVLWAAILAVAVSAIAIATFGGDADSFNANLGSVVEQIVRPSPTMSAETRKTLIAIFVLVIPPAAAVLAIITNLLNLWLAAKIVRFSGRLQRPWPDLSALDFPKWAAWTLAALMAASFLGGLLGILSAAAAASFLTAYGILGLAVMHAITRNMRSRGLVLSGVYAAVLVFGWPMLALCVLGLTETAIGIRRRVATRRGPPSRTSSSFE